MCVFECTGLSDFFLRVMMLKIWKILLWAFSFAEHSLLKILNHFLTDTYYYIFSFSTLHTPIVAAHLVPSAWQVKNFRTGMLLHYKYPTSSQFPLSHTHAHTPYYTAKIAWYMWRVCVCVHAYLHLNGNRDRRWVSHMSCHRTEQTHYR